MKHVAWDKVGSEVSFESIKSSLESTANTSFKARVIMVINHPKGSCAIFEGAKPKVASQAVRAFMGFCKGTKIRKRP